MKFRVEQKAMMSLGATSSPVLRLTAARF